MAPSADTFSPGLRAKYNAEVTRLTTMRSQPTQGTPKICYEPDISNYLAEASSKACVPGAETKVAEGWPQVLKGPMAWVPSDFTTGSDWVFRLSSSHKEEIDRALGHFKELDLAYEKSIKGIFPLSILASDLVRTRDEIYQGQGFAVIRGLDPDIYTPLEFAIIFLGISSYIAERRGKQDQRGSMMNPSCKEDNPSRGKQPFHTDVVCDNLALATRNCSAKGGHGFVASTWTVYNELAATRPDLIRVLSKPNWPHDTYGRSPPFFNKTLLYHTDGKIILNFSQRPLTGHLDSPRTAGIPDLMEEQVEALNAIHFIAQKHQIDMLMKKGDLRFINNMTMVHC